MCVSMPFEASDSIIDDLLRAKQQKRILSSISEKIASNLHVFFQRAMLEGHSLIHTLTWLKSVMCKIYMKKIINPRK